MNTKKIGLLVRTENEWSRQVLMGVAQYAIENGGWDFILPKSDEDGNVALPDTWNGDGIICRLSTDLIWQQVVSANVPAVNISWLGMQYSDIPTVTSDEWACGKFAAEYFLERHFKNFGFVGPRPWEGYQTTLHDSVKQSLSQQNLDLATFQYPNQNQFSQEFSNSLGRWLTQLPKPVALVVWSSELGRMVSAKCVELGMVIPNEVSMVCVEHDALASSLSPTPLSSLDQDPWRVGYTAANTLHRLMDGHKIEQQQILVPPISIVQRFSSEASAVQDDLVREVYRYIHEHVGDGLNVDEIVRHFGVSRRSLEKKFQDHLQRSPAQIIRRARLAIVKRLLRETTLTLPQIAERSGFSQAEVLSRAFKKETGVTPSQFRGTSV